MTRYVLMVNLRDDRDAIAAYRRYHDEVWPEVVQSLRNVGVERMDIYLLDRRAVMVLEMADGRDYRAAFKTHVAAGGRVAEWESLMKTLQEPRSDAAPDDWWASMESIFHMDTHEPAIAPFEPARVS